MTRFAACREVKLVTVREEPFRSSHTSTVDSPKQIVDLWREIVSKSAWYHDEKEHLVCFCLDARFRVKSFSLISMGSLNECLAHPREIFRPAIADSAHSIVVVHNHPSGDPNPSRLDLSLTRRLYLVADLLQIPLLDHVIVGGERYFSFREVRRLWPESEKDASRLNKMLERKFPEPARRMRALRAKLNHRRERAPRQRKK
jgi:DNA repair protein RadC